MNIMVFPIWILIGLAIPALLIAGVVLLFVKLRAKAWWIVGPVLGLGLLVVVPAVLGLHFIQVPYARSARQVNTYVATPDRTHTFSVSDVADGNSARGIASDQSYYNEDGSAYAEPSGEAAAASRGSGRGGGEPTRGWALGGGVLVALLVALLIALLIAGVVVLFVKLRAKAWWVVGPVLGLGLLVVGLRAVSWSSGASPSRRSTSYQATYSRTGGGNSRSNTIAVVRSGGALMPAVPPDSASAERISETFLADVYPSAVQAAEALAKAAAKSFHESSGVNSSATTSPAEPLALPDVLVTGLGRAMATGRPSQDEARILQAIVDTLRVEMLARSVSIMQTGPTTGPASRPVRSGKEIICTVIVRGSKSGTIGLGFTSPDRRTSHGTRFVTKPWAADFAQYVAGADKPVVRAASPAVATFEQAQQEALQDAARQLEPYVRSAISSGPMEEPGYVEEGKPAISVPGGRVDSRIIREALVAELHAGRLILDRFPQQFDRPYGKVWREQILVDASQNAMERVAFEAVTRLDMLAGAEAHQRAAKRQTWWALTVSLGGLVVLIFAVYLVLNAATKGYYTWVLRLLAIGAIIAGVALVIVVA